MSKLKIKIHKIVVPSDLDNSKRKENILCCFDIHITVSATAMGIVQIYFFHFQIENEKPCLNCPFFIVF